MLEYKGKWLLYRGKHGDRKSLKAWQGRRSAPCNPAPSSDPWRRARWSSRRSTSQQRQRRPAHKCQHKPIQTPQNSRFTYHGEFVKRPGLLNVLQRGGEVLELEVDGLLGGLGVLDGLDLEGVDGLDLAIDVVGGGLEVLEAALDLVDDGRVLQHGAVGGEVDSRGLIRQLLDLAARVLVALLEGLEGGHGLAAEAQRGGDLGPVELESGASLYGRREKISSRLLGDAEEGSRRQGLRGRVARRRGREGSIDRVHLP